MTDDRPPLSDPWTTSPNDNGEDQIDLREYWRILVERWGVILTCLTVTVTAAVLVTFLSTPEYRATTTLQIERKGPETLTFQDVLDIDPAGYRNFYETQNRIIQSRTVLRLAAERMDLVNRPEFVGRKGPPVVRLYRWAKSILTGPEEEDLLREAIVFLEQRLTVAPIRNSRLVEISFMDPDAALASEVANAVSDAYQQFSLEARYTTSEQVSEFLTKEVARLQSEIQGNEQTLQEYGSKKAILALSDGTQDISEQALADLSTRLTAVKGQLAVAEARYNELQEAPTNSFPEVLSSPLINHLKQRYAEVERHHNRLSEQFKSGWPDLDHLGLELALAREQMEIETEAIAGQVRAVARADYDQTAATVANLERQVEEQKQEVQRVNRDRIEYESLHSEIATRRDVLSRLVTRQSETETSGQFRDTRISNIRVLDRAEVPDKPARPRKALNLILSVLVGLGFGVCMVFVLHHVDNSIKTEQDIERYGGGVAVLGHVPLFEPLRVPYGGPKPEAILEGDEMGEPSPPSPDLAGHELPRSAFAEAFKNLRTSLLLASPDHPPRHIHVTSCGPGDGKSTIALNLAIVLTQAGKRVLLVDADLRRPRLHRALSLQNDVGLSAYLAGHVDLEALLRETYIPGLHAITSGPTPPNPSELLGSPGLENLMQGLGALERYDHVLFDSPPVVHVADSLILSARMDATILVVRSGTTKRESLFEGLARLRQGRAWVAGTVLNAVSELSGYYYYRRYDYDSPDEPRDNLNVGAAGAPSYFSRIRSTERSARRRMRLVLQLRNRNRRRAG